MQSLVRHFKVDLARADPHWPAQVAALVSILLFVALPDKLSFGPSWWVPLLEAMLFVALVLATPEEDVPSGRTRRRIAVAFVGVLVVVDLLALGLLAHYVIEGGRAAHGLLEAAAVLWCTMVLTFSLVYWELDRGGPVARAHPDLAEPHDFLFSQTTGEGRELAPAWQPAFVDYLYVSLTNSTAFSPTDTMPLTRRAKLMMGIQGVAAMITIGLLIARAVGTLR